MKQAIIDLPYFKQGDDLRNFLKPETSNEQALENHAQMLDEAATILRSVKNYIAGRDDVEFDAYTHRISILAPDELIDQLVADGLANIEEFDDDEEEFDDEDEEFEEEDAE